MNDIIHTLEVINLPTDELVIKNVSRNPDGSVVVTVEKKRIGMYCENCGCRMHSKGIYHHIVNHPVLNGHYAGTLILDVVQRKWRCPDCGTYSTDEFTFLEKRKQSTTILPLMILNEMKDLNVTCRQVAERLHISDTHVHTTFLRYVDMKPLPLSRIISIDEVHMNFNNRDRYAMIIMDFITNEIIEILPNRGREVTDAFFRSIPQSEKDKVEYIVSDMYKPYINYAGTTFKHARPVVDSFHVISWLLNKINLYINDVKKRYQARDRKSLEEKNYRTNRDYKTIKESDEVILLKKHRWIILKKQDDIHYSGQYRHVKGLRGIYLTTDQLEKKFLDLDPHFREIRELKEKYFAFNSIHVNDFEGAEHYLDDLINMYRACSIALFREFAELLSTYRKEIISSFKYISAESIKTEADSIENFRRLSNGPIEGFNNKPKDLKRISNGVSNFEFVRNRILWATRKDAVMLGVPKTDKEVHTYTGKVRGPYKKK